MPPASAFVHPTFSPVPEHSRTGLGPLIPVPGWFRHAGKNPASAFLPVVNCVYKASAFRNQGQSGTTDEGLVRYCPTMPFFKTTVLYSLTFHPKRHKNKPLRCNTDLRRRQCKSLAGLSETGLPSQNGAEEY
jgi:hypothetical protein